MNILEDDEKDVIRADDLLKKGVVHGGSDVHLKPGSPPKMRVNGQLIPIPGYSGIILTGAMTERLASETLVGEDLGNFFGGDGRKDYDYSYEIPGLAAFRMNVSHSRGHLAVVARILPPKPKTLLELGIPTQIGHLVEQHKSGLIIVTGPTGSGKSRTMAGLVDLINKNQQVHILSIEDPIEVIHEDAMASISQKEIGVDVNSYDDGLKAAMRQDPDVILIGEIRSSETLHTVIDAAETGHLVISTLHTVDASTAMNRIMALFGEENQTLGRDKIAGILRAVVAQRLLPGVDGSRVAANELLLNNQEIAHHISHGASPAEYREVLLKSKNMFTFEKRMVELIELGKITLDVAKSYSDHPEYFDNIQLKTPAINPPKPTTQRTLPPLTKTSPQLPAKSLPRKPATGHSHNDPARWLET